MTDTLLAEVFYLAASFSEENNNGKDSR